MIFSLSEIFSFVITKMIFSFSEIIIFMLFSLFISLRNLYIALENIKQKQIFAITIFPVGLYVPVGSYGYGSCVFTLI